MTSGMIWAVFLCGLGTFLLRWAPLWRARRHAQSAGAAGGMRKLLIGVGPAAIAALFVVSARGLFAEDAQAGKMVIVALALGVTAATRRVCRGGVAVPTLAGALAYGVLLACLSV